MNKKMTYIRPRMAVHHVDTFRPIADSGHKMLSGKEPQSEPSAAREHNFWEEDGGLWQ